MRHLPYALPALLLVVLGCSRSISTPTAIPETSVPTAALGGIASPAADLTEAALGVWTITIDPGTMQATASLAATREGVATDDVYLLSISNFLRPNSFKIGDIQRNGGTLSLECRFTHPFAAPSNLSGAPTATNRADLGIAGRMLFLTDVTSATGNSYFAGGGDPVIARTGLLINADGYYRPNGLLTTSTLANTFPYLSLVDDSGTDGSRVGVSNGGNPQGNFSTDGWTGQDMGSTLDQWTGYGVLHQGQSTACTLDIDLADLDANGPFSFDVAILAKYNDPRGGATGAEKKANRLPPPSADYTRFAYRMPHGALDVERIAYLGQTDDLVENEISSTVMSFHVTDWDARATETAETDLALDPTFTNVAPGESGLPTLSVCIPGVLGTANDVVTFDPQLDFIDDDSSFGGDAAQDSGIAGDPICFSKLIDKTITSGQTAGLYKGLARAEDVEFGQDLAGWKFPLDESLMPLAGNYPEPVSYQSFEVVLEPATPPANGWGTAWGGTGNDFSYTLDVDSEGSSFVSGYYASATNFGGGLRANAGSSDIYLLKLNPDGTYAWDKTFGNTSAQIGWAVHVDNADNVYLGGQIRGDLDFGGGVMSSPTTNDGFFVKFDNDGNFLWQKYYPTTSTVDRATGISSDNLGNVYFANQWGTSVDYGGGVRTGPGAAEIAIIKLTSAGTYVWDYTAVGPGADVINGVGVDGSGNVWATGYFTQTCDFGTGPVSTYTGSATSASDSWVVRLNSAGAYQLLRTYGELGSEQGLDLKVDSSGNVYHTGYFRSPSVNFGGGPVGLNPGGTTPEDSYLVKLDSSGNYLWARIFGSDNQDTQPLITLDGNDNVYWNGRFRGTVDLGLGPIVPTSFLSTWVVKYNPAGVIQWNSVIQSVDNPGGVSIAQNGGYGLACDDANNLIMAGFYNEHADLDPGPGTFDVTSNLGTGDNNAYVTKLLGTNGLWN